MPTNIDEEIQQLINELEELKIEFISKSNLITKKLTRLSRKVKRNNQTRQSNDIEVGNIVRITNNYKGSKGITGIVERITDKQVILHNENTGETYTRSKNNVEEVL